jgi:hypothetical protein
MKWFAAAVLVTVALAPTPAGAAAVSPHSWLPPGACAVRYCGPLDPAQPAENPVPLPLPRY